MKTYGRSLKVIALAIGVLTMSGCASLDAGHASVVPGAKVDSGLGNLPHYRNWVDPTGRTPMAPMLTASISTTPRLSPAASAAGAVSRVLGAGPLPASASSSARARAIRRCAPC